MGMYDQGARYAAAAEPDFVLTRLRPETGLTLAFRKLLPTKGLPLPGGPDRDADLALVCDEVKVKQDEVEDLAWLLIVEAQTTHVADKPKVLQLEAMIFLNYAKDLDRGGVDFHPLAVFIYLTGECPGEGVVGRLTPTGRGQRGWPALWEVAKDDARETLAKVVSGEYSWGALFWVVLMLGANDEEVIALWLKLLDEKVPAKLRSDVVHVALTFAELLVGRKNAWEDACKGVEMTESAYINEQTARARLIESRGDLLLFVEGRFPEILTPDVRKAIDDQPSLALMKTWIKEVSVAKTADDFLAVLRR